MSQLHLFEIQDGEKFAELIPTLYLILGVCIAACLVLTYLSRPRIKGGQS